MSLRNSLVTTIKSDEIKNISTDIVEAILDSNLEDGILKDIPVIGTIVNIGKGIMSIQDRLFAKKLLGFLTKLKEIPEGQRRTQIEKIENSKEEKVKIGDKILYLIQRSDDHIKSEMIGVLFADFLKEVIDYETFKRCSDCINRAYLGDIEWLIKTNHVELSMEESSDLLSSGLFEMPDSLTLVSTGIDSEYAEESFSIEGYDKVQISYWGEIIRKSLKGKI